MASQNNSLGYIVIEGTEGQLRGAALVTDIKGVPSDYCYTDPIRPNKQQRILFGDSFAAYVKEKLVLDNILEALDYEPQLWICRDKDILDPLRESSKKITVMLEESPHVPLDAAGIIENTASPGVFLIQADEHGAPLRAEFPEGTRQDEVQMTAAILTENAKTMTILEPFNRLQRLISALAAGLTK